MDPRPHMALASREPVTVTGTVVTTTADRVTGSDLSLSRISVVSSLVEVFEPRVAHLGPGRVGGGVSEQSLGSGLGLEPCPVVGELAIDHDLFPAQHRRHQPGHAVGCQLPAVGYLEGDVRAAREHVVDVQSALVGRSMGDLGSQVSLGSHEGGSQARVGRDKVEHFGCQRAVARYKVVQLGGRQMPGTGVAAQPELGA